MLESNYKYLIWRGNELTFAEMPLHNHLWMAKRRTRPKAFPQRHTEWWTAGLSQRKKTCTRTQFSFNLWRDFLCYLNVNRDWPGIGIINVNRLKQPLAGPAQWYDCGGCWASILRPIYLQINEEKYFAKCQYTSKSRLFCCVIQPFSHWRPATESCQTTNVMKKAHWYKHDVIFCRWKIHCFGCKQGSQKTMGWCCARALWQYGYCVSSLSRIILSRFLYPYSRTAFHLYLPHLPALVPWWEKKDEEKV